MSPLQGYEMVGDYLVIGLRPMLLYIAPLGLVIPVPQINIEYAFF